MKVISLLLFRIRTAFQKATYVVLLTFSTALAGWYQKHMLNYEERFAIKSLRHGWEDVMLKKMKHWCNLKNFRRELIIDEYKAGNNVVYQMLKELNKQGKGLEDHFTNIEIELLMLNRRYFGMDEEMNFFKRFLLNSPVKHKKELIKIFYMRSHLGEPNLLLATQLVDMFSDDYEFIAYLAKNRDSHRSLHSKFIAETLLLQGSVTRCGNITKARQELKDYVLEVGFGKCDLKRFGYNQLLAELREHLYDTDNIAAWEKYLFDHADVYIIRDMIAIHGIHSEEGIQRLLEKNDGMLIEAYNHYKKNHKP